jgi:hypothetical protein
MWPQYGGGRARAATSLAHVLILAAILTPLAATSALFLYDTANHAFRSQLIANLASGKDSAFYYFQLRLIPNMPIDLFALLTRAVLDPLVSVAILTVAICAGFYLSIVYWRRAGERTTSIWLCLLVALVLYSMPLSYGLINYILGLALLNVCAARLEHNGEQPTIEFCIGQWVLVVLMYLCSLFPLVLYGCWIFGTVLFDLYRGGGSKFLDLVRRNSILHLPPLVAIVALMLLSNPVPSVESVGLMWSLDRKLGGLVSVGRMTHFPYEFAFPFLIYGLIGLKLWSGTFVIGARHLAGLTALLVLYLAAPAEVYGASLVELRLPMAITAVFLATVSEAPVRARPRASATATFLIGALVCARVASLAMTWTAAQALLPPYAELARLVPERSAVMFVYCGASRSLSTRPAEWLEHWKGMHKASDLFQPDKLHLYMDYWHLHMAYFRDRDVYLSNTFQNFTVHKKPDVRFRIVETPLAWKVVPDLLASDPYDYVLSHEDLSELVIPGKCLCPVAARGSVRLYQLSRSRESAAGALPTCGCSQMADGR